MAATQSLSFACTTAHEVAEHVAQTLAYSETQGVGWLRGALMYIDLMPHPPGLGGPAAVPRVVMRADDADAARMLGVDRWVEVQTPQMSGQHLLRLKVPFWLLTETGSCNGKPLSNLAIAKRLAETLLLVRSKLRDVVHPGLNNSFLVEAFASAVHEPEPPPLNDAQCISFMELADAWRDHIVSTWRHVPALPMLTRRISPMPPLTEKVMDEESPPPLPPPPRELDPKEFPALGPSPCRSPPHTLFGYAKVLPPRLDRNRRATHVPNVRLDDAEALWGVNWIGDPACNEQIWLRCGKSPQKIAADH